MGNYTGIFSGPVGIIAIDRIAGCQTSKVYSIAFKVVKVLNVPSAINYRLIFLPVVCLSVFDASGIQT
jgi:hypothetical protein